MKTIVDLILRMALENRSWRYTRIRGALANLGHDVGRGTIANILHEHGIEPVPERDRHTRWSTFLKAHWECLSRMIFFGQDSLQHAISQFMAHYHAERNHQGLENRLVLADAQNLEAGDIARVILPFRSNVQVHGVWVDDADLAFA